MATNPFLILGASFDAEMSDLKRIAKLRLMEFRLDGNENCPEARQIDNALDELSDPVKRYEYGVLALSLTPSEAESFRADPVLGSLGQNVPPNVADRYQEVCPNSEADDFGMNLAVLKYARALHSTQSAQHETPDDPDDDLELIPIWRDALGHFSDALGNSKFWATRKLNAKCIDDPRLTPKVVEEINGRVWHGILSPISSIIGVSLQQRHAKVAKAFVGLVSSSGAPEEIIDEVLSSVYKPICDEIERDVDRLEEELDALIPTSKDHKKWKAILDEFERKCLPLLRLVIQVGDLPGYAEEHARDKSAEFLSGLSISCWNKTDHGPTATRAMELASEIADSKSLREKYAGEVRELGNLLKTGPLWKKLKHAVDRQNWSEAKAIIDQLLVHETGKERAMLLDMRNKLSRITASSSGCLVPIAIGLLLTIAACS